MYSSFQLAIKYLRYYLAASNGKGHGMHSPFVFEFIQHVLNNKSDYRPPPAIEVMRQDLLHNKNLVAIEDLGAGSRKGASPQKTVDKIASTSVKPKKYGQMLHRLCRHYKPQSILEFGTSLGITTSYLASANENSQVTTIEGSTEIAQIAAANFEKLHFQNIQLLTGSFDHHLPTIISSTQNIDLVYVDGNHNYSPTMKYFRALLERANSSTIMVFDDIHWSADMEKAWEEIKGDERVQYTIDIFFLGFVFFRKEFKVKQHFMVRF